MAQLIVERNTIINHILPEVGREDCSETHQTLKSLISLYNSYLKKAKEPQKEGYSWVGIRVVNKVTQEILLHGCLTPLLIM